jgi:hypothetical protein
MSVFLWAHLLVSLESGEDFRKAIDQSDNEGRVFL